ncbi:hypothetical protein [Bradyrhizobium canariense]|uniref:hypothetical protein n=1 Tax=Bradyrhizobium canariense TaxID=255045 RepID=UPI001177D457|nr:hypothetical protein [Bradyrhizobium canariense]
MPIRIDVALGDTVESSSATGTGSSSSIITDAERRTFSVDNDRLKDSLAVFMGKKPNDVFVRSPTPWNDLYETYNWPQTERNTIVRSVQVLEVRIESETIRQRIINSGSRPAPFPISFSRTVTNTVTSKWSNSQSISFGLKAEIKFGKVFQVGIGASIEWRNTWGSEETVTESVTVATGAGVSMILDPGECAVIDATFKSTEGIVRVEYESSLSGNVAMNYHPRYRGHHFFTSPTAAVMSRNDIANRHITTQTFGTKLHKEVILEVKDDETSETLRSFRSDLPLVADGPIILA